MTSVDIHGNVFLNYEGERTRELLLGSSISANNMLCGMFVLLSLFKHKIIRLNLMSFVALQFFLMLSTFNTQSRFPMFVAAIIFLYSILGLNKIKLKNILLLASACLGLFAVAAIIDITIYDYFSRFSQDSGGRVDKLEATFILITNSLSDFFIGSSNEMVESTVVNGAVISDNSYSLIAASFGVPFTLVFFAYILFTLKNLISDEISLLMFFYMVVGFALTNCILWEPWVFTVFLSFAVVAYYGGNVPQNKSFLTEKRMLNKSI
jgi:hypothetical protein